MADLTCATCRGTCKIQTAVYDGVPYQQRPCPDCQAIARPRLLDLFCGAGGAAMGYSRAGFEVVGVDIDNQPNYPFEFVRCDAMRILSLLAYDSEPWPSAPWFDAVHVSPPCQDYIRGGSHPVHETGWMLPAARYYLERQRRPWVIENVPGAPMRADYKLCGCMFDLRIPLGYLRRERWFEASWQPFEMRPPCSHRGIAISVAGHGTQAWTRDKLGRCPSAAEYRALMGIDWTTRDELSQAIPPAYTEHIGRQLIESLAVAHG